MKRSIVVGEQGARLWVVTLTGTASDAEFDEYLAALSHRMKLERGPKALVYDARLAEPAPARQRRKQADWMKRNAGDIRAKVAGTAFVLPSAQMRGALTAILWLQPLASQHLVTGDLESGVRWARERLQAAGARLRPYPDREGV